LVICVERWRIAGDAVVDAVTRLLRGAGNEASSQMSRLVRQHFADRSAIYCPLQLSDEHRASDHQLAESNGLLDYPHYTRPAEFRGWAVPEVLVAGITRKWQMAAAAALEKTRRNRPDFCCEIIWRAILKVL